MQFSDPERDLLRSIAPQMRALLAEPDDPALQRLFPPAYHEEMHAEYQDEYKRFMQEELINRHTEALEVLEKTADSSELSAEQLDAWARAINQVRLAIGTRLDVREDDDPSAGADRDHQLYYLLGYLQQCVVDALSGER